MEDAKLCPTRDGERLIEALIVAIDRRRMADDEAARAHDDWVRAVTAFAQWMLPKDAAIDEKYLMWYGQRLVQVETTMSGPKVSFPAVGQR